MTLSPSFGLRYKLRPVGRVVTATQDEGDARKRERCERPLQILDLEPRGYVSYGNGRPTRLQTNALQELRLCVSGLRKRRPYSPNCLSN